MNTPKLGRQQLREAKEWVKDTFCLYLKKKSRELGGQQQNKNKGKARGKTQSKLHRQYAAPKMIGFVFQKAVLNIMMEKLTGCTWPT